MKRLVTGVMILGLVLTPVLASAKNGSGPGSSAGGGNNGNGGGISNGGGQGGGNGGNGGHGGNGNGGGNNGGGNGGGGNGSGDGGNGGGGSTGNGGGTSHGGSATSGMGSAASGTSVDGASVSVVGGGDGNGDLIAAVKACENERPGLAIGDVRGATWSFRTFDDTVWPYVYRCMAARGYKAYGTDFSQTTNFGTR